MEPATPEGKLVLRPVWLARCGFCGNHFGVPVDTPEVGLFFKSWPMASLSGFGICRAVMAYTGVGSYRRIFHECHYAL